MASNGGSDLFETYESEYNALQAELKSKLEGQLKAQIGEQRKATLRAAEREVEEGEEILGQMELEVLNLPTSARTRLQAKLRGYKHDFDKIKRDIRRATTSAPTAAEREELFGFNDSTSDLDSTAVDQRARLLSGTDRLNESSQRLQNSHRIALETENVGVGVLGSLRSQRESIMRTRDTLSEADSYVDRASRTLKGMARRMATNRMITIAIILVLIAMIILVIWSKFG
ncbi:hypothetical protein BZG36_00694 [Bifiguratus adelaidae]|uniref:t-SNARE coiled-coil homology domain-containing protein n=1 Tax=Bifiguratus adelaidae TaxID=1938954 RepID=A0A261Y704_9FUNG|nr:hypothetical protein BZG36_00694 [Bifiguratus adelaidae]